MTADRRLQLPLIGAVLLLTVAQVAITFLPLAGVGESIGQRSAEAPTLITPPGWSFAIWGPIYAALAVHAVWQALPANHLRLAPPRGWVAAGLALNTLWPLLFQLGGTSGWTVATILGEALCWVAAMLRVPAGVPRDRWLVALPLGAIGGWVTAASILDASAWLGNVAAVPLPALAPEYWVAVMALAGSAIAAVVIRRSGNGWYALTFAWALIGIAAKSWSIGNRWGLIAAAAGLALTAAAWVGTRRRQTVTTV